MEWKGERLETFVYNESTIEHLHRYAIALQLAAGKDVADIACGEGYGTNLLADVARSVAGIDNDKQTIFKASKKYTNNKIKFLECDILNIPLPDHSVDVVVSFETLEHVTAHQEFITEIKRILRKTGVLLISTPNKAIYSDQPGYKNPFHLKELYENEFRQLLNGNFSFTRILQQVCTYGSIIKNETDEKETFDIFKGDFKRLTRADRFNPEYLLAIASDTPVEYNLSSIFIGEQIFQQSLRLKEAALKKTISYRLGHFLLFPFKLVRKLIK